MAVGSWKTVKVEVGDGIAWVEPNRPEKRNAMKRLRWERTTHALRVGLRQRDNPTTSAANPSK